MTISVAIVYHSGYGHTARQAQAVAEGVNSVASTSATLVKVEDVEQHWATLEKADAIIFGAPTYMGSVSAPFKSFMDASSKVWMQRLWADKVAAGFTNSASRSGDKLSTLMQINIFAAQHGMHWVNLNLLPGHNKSDTTEDTLNRHGFFLGAAAQSNADQGADVAPSSADLKTAHYLGQRVANVAHEMALGRVARAAA